MSKAIAQFNGLNGTVATREELQQLSNLANQEEQYHIKSRIDSVLENDDDDKWKIEIQENAFEIAPKSMLNGLHFEENTDEDGTGLNKAVSSTEIYQMITDKMLAMIKEASGQGYVKKWKGNVYGKGYTIPFNFDSKKRYRGVNVFLLTGFEPLENPFFMTFKQIEAHKGTIKKGSKGSPVVYFTNLYKITDKNRNIDFGTYDLKKAKDFADKNGFSHADIKTLPILKYYNVFNGKDIDGINFDLENFKIGYIENDLPNTEKLPVAEAIINTYPAPAPKLKHGGNRAFYSPSGDYIQMPQIADFETVQDYYRTLFHEFSHSTGNYNRLDRDFSGRFGSKPYAFEELVAEWGATFLSAEAGIIWHSNKNHAEYLKNWNSVLTHLADDNKFIMRACTKAQELTDYVLQFDENGTPKYMETLEVEAPKIEEKKPVAKVQKKTKKPVEKIEPKFKIGDIVVLKGEKILEKEILSYKLNRKREIVYTAKYISKPTEKGTFFENELEFFKKTSSVPKVEPKPKADSKGFYNKPKSVSVATAVNDILSTGKYKGLKPLQANLLFSTFKNDSEKTIDELPKYQSSIFKNLENYLYFLNDSDGNLYEVSLTELGKNFINSVNGRTESLRNQKNNYALFDGLKKSAPKKHAKISKIGLAGNDQESEFYTVAGEVGKFLQQVERKPVESVVITLDGQQGAGKTTTLYKFMDSFAIAGNSCLFLSLEEHPASSLAKDKVSKYLSTEAQENIDTVGEVESISELYDFIKDYEIIFIDSWQKLQRMVGLIRLDEDLRKKFNGKVFVVIFQQTTTGRTKGGAEVVFDGDIIIKMVKESSFAENYAYFDKNRYTLIAIEDIRYNIASGTTYNPNAKEEPATELQPVEEVEFNFIVK